MESTAMYNDYLQQCQSTFTQLPRNTTPFFPAFEQANATIPANADFLFVPLYLNNATWSYSETKDKFINESQHNSSLCSLASTTTASSTAVSLPVTAAATAITSVALNGSEPYQTAPGANASSSVEKSRSVSAGTIAGIVVAGVLLLGILLGALWYARRQRRKAEPYVSRRDEIQGASGDDKERPKSAGARKAGAYLSGMSITPLLSRRAGSPATNSSIPPSINFYPDAMVRQGNGGRASPRPFSAAYSETLPGYTGWDRKSIGEKSIGEKSVVSERTDSRVQLSTEDSPDPYMPLQPLRLDSKE
ncbi:uncharacterized protein TRAVEDRAFT_46841 [Trametes versicolor FP-101664 SS1]|uniref:uncharacterized protein n=1 Tax=Trametes versicolor (strain FP-101664) TaxID=717944 RepID=UPI0004622421|nr:uncharacterized protein TRAVEDRAFT_46841 [Trametes versicolor FP-101664 SS1]EIW59534.1 hypothetical protein TRAVEDRAFT_46841 [Trametes versicolor FP-101664 SS1]